jgi:hypothetical protein
MRAPNARESVSAYTNSAAPCTSTRTFAAESVAGAVGSGTVAVALWATQHIRHISVTLPIGKRLHFYFPAGNKKRSAGSTLAAQAASL